MDALPPIQHFAITADEIIGCDDFASVRGAYVMTLSPGAGTTPQTDRGHYMGVLRKQPDGSWLWSRDMAVSELSLGSG
jgi:ketosteroid isomerase-like protein